MTKVTQLEMMHDDTIHYYTYTHPHTFTPSHSHTFTQESAPGIIIAHGNLGSQVSSNPDLYISRDGGVTWVETLQSSWGVVMADNGGLLVAAKDYHQEPSSELMYSCNEGKTWQSFSFSNTDMIIFGVLTEPGEFTTTVRWVGHTHRHKVLL